MSMQSTGHIAEGREGTWKDLSTRVRMLSVAPVFAHEIVQQKERLLREMEPHGKLDLHLVATKSVYASMLRVIFFGDVVLLLTVRFLFFPPSNVRMEGESKRHARARRQTLLLSRKECPLHYSIEILDVLRHGIERVPRGRKAQKGCFGHDWAKEFSKGQPWARRAPRKDSVVHKRDAPVRENVSP